MLCWLLQKVLRSPCLLSLLVRHVRAPGECCTLTTIKAVKLFFKRPHRILPSGKQTVPPGSCKGAENTSHILCLRLRVEDVSMKRVGIHLPLATERESLSACPFPFIAMARDNALANS